MAPASRQGRWPLRPGRGTYGGDGISEISLADVTPRLAWDTRFEGVVDLLKVARHGAGQRVFLVDFVLEAE
jgi:hypothetical protein